MDKAVERNTAPSTARTELQRILLDTAGHLALAPDIAAAFLHSATLDIDGMIVTVTVFDPEDGAVDHDVAVVCQPGIGVSTLEQAQLILRSNLVLSASVGCSFGTTGDGALHLLRGARLATLDGETVATTMCRIAAIARAMRQDLATLAPAKAAAAAAGHAGSL